MSGVQEVLGLIESKSYKFIINDYHRGVGFSNAPPGVCPPARVIVCPGYESAGVMQYFYKSLQNNGYVPGGRGPSGEFFVRN